MTDQQISDMASRAVLAGLQSADPTAKQLAADVMTLVGELVRSRTGQPPQDYTPPQQRSPANGTGQPPRVVVLPSGMEGAPPIAVDLSIDPFASQVIQGNKLAAAEAAKQPRLPDPGIQPASFDALGV